MSRASRVVLRCYPPSFHARYGEELRELVDELPSSPRSTLDLAWGALRAWFAPRFVGADRTRLRMQASVSTTWFAWCIGFLIAPTMAKALLDPIAHGTPSAAVVLVHVGSASLVAGWLAAAAGVVTVLAGGVITAAKTSSRAVLGPLIVPISLGIVSVAVLAVLTTVDRGAGLPRVGTELAISGLAVLVVAFLIALGAGPAIGLRKAQLTQRALRPATILASVMAAALVIATGSGLAAAVVADNGELFGSVVPMIAALVAALLAAVVATVSSVRGLGALRVTQRR